MLIESLINIIIIMTIIIIIILLDDDNQLYAIIQHDVQAHFLGLGSV